ncbi:uncharacterized protein [Hemitrygon akajei]|uniref:uncharacterized protein n=1 Tax=Hemitrygon akajei TaxID=2704970 RepID=UPI003BF95602
MGDGNLEVGWYRFNSSGGWKIPETVVPQGRCSGETSGWLHGPHPNVGEGEVTRTVCFTVGEYACQWSQEIKVKNCSGYFVYRLWPIPWDHAVYCMVTDSALGDPCVIHIVLGQPWRSTDCSNTECTGGQWMDDGNLAVGWYRFNSSGGWKIPETVVPQYHCSGENPGWLNGSHPNVGEGEVTRTVCFTESESTCYWSLDIKVKNCSGYFVYLLKPTPLGDTVSGGRKIPETVVPQGHCSGWIPGWLNGPHPNVGEGEVTRTICFTESESTCYWSLDIKVKNCSGYFVYWLKPTPLGDTVYCTVTDSTLGDPCVTHTILDQPWRSTNCSNTECTGGQWMDDGNLEVGWYRFNSSGGWKIPETFVPEGHCSGEIPGWLNGPHPNVGEGEVTRTVCFTWAGDTCHWIRGIRVKNCSDYFVYRLWPTSSYYHDTEYWNYAVYCTDLGSSPSEQAKGSSTGGATQEPSSVPSGDTSSGRKT